MAAKLRWIKYPSTLAREVEIRSDNLVDEMDSGMSQLAGEAADWMKSNAPWNDRTGNARRGLQANYEFTGTTSSIRFQHTVRYGKFLEGGTRYMSKYPIILPAIQRFSPKARAVMNRAVKAVVG